MTEQGFGRLKKIDLREGWPTEAGDFTPWLAKPENLSLLGETIGLELEPLHQEHPVGPYRADLICQDQDNEERVLIENQLSKTDHKHLGQLLTYASNLKAVNIVWIARKFTDEHKSALEWLNNHTDDGIRLFGLEIELWKIGGSQPAPKFNIISKPNEWVKAGTSTGSSSGSDRKTAQLQYWMEFDDWLSQQGGNDFRLAPPRGTHWLSERAYGTTGIKNSLTISTFKKEIGCEMYLGNYLAKARFAVLEQHKDRIEKSFGGPLEWQLLPKKIACRIKTTMSDTDWQDEKDRPRQFEWLQSSLRRLTQAMMPHLADLRSITEPLAAEDADGN